MDSKRLAEERPGVNSLSPTVHSSEGRNTDLANARRLVSVHGGNIRYCHELKTWFIWDERCWKNDINGAIERKAKDVIREMHIWRRVLRLPFMNVIQSEHRDKRSKTRLKDPKVAGPAILAWAVKGCLNWQRHGLGMAPAVSTVISNYRDQMDGVSSFMEERCVVGSGLSVGITELWDIYSEWQLSEPVQSLDRKGFAHALELRGFKRGRTRI